MVGTESALAVEQEEDQACLSHMKWVSSLVPERVGETNSTHAYYFHLLSLYVCLSFGAIEIVEIIASFILCSGLPFST